MAYQQPRYTAKRIDITNKKGNTRPAELVFQTFASSFHCFVSSVNISFSVPLAQGQSLGHQIKALSPFASYIAPSHARASFLMLRPLHFPSQEALDLEAKELRNGVVLVNGTRVDEDALIGPDTGSAFVPLLSLRFEKRHHGDGKELTWFL